MEPIRHPYGAHVEPSKPPRLTLPEPIMVSRQIVHNQRAEIEVGLMKNLYLRVYGSVNDELILIVKYKL